MNFNVKFASTVTGDIDDLDLLINGELVPSPGFKVNLTEAFASHGNLTVKYQISGLNGTDFKIEYTCATSAAPTSDPTKPSPVSGTITSNGFKEITLTIAI